MTLRATVFVIGILSRLSCSSGQDVEARFEKSLKDVKSLSRVQLEWVDTLWVGDPEALKAMKIDKAAFSRTLRYSYIASGPRYRASCNLVSGTKTNLLKQQESAFDGSIFSDYRGDFHDMAKMHDDPRGGGGQSPYNPLIAPFMFLTKHSDDCLPCMLRFTDLISRESTNELILPTGQKSNSLVEISIPGLQLGKQPTTWRITIEEAGDSFTPKVISQVAGGFGAEIVYKLLNYTNLGPYQFPTRIEWSSSAYPPTSPATLLETGTVTLISARVPDQIADSMFRLDEEEKSAVRVWDWGQKKFTKVAPEDAEAKAKIRALPKIYDESADGTKQIAEALQIAKGEHKHVLLQFGANWCGPCHELHRLFETNQSVAAELKRAYVVVMIDMNKGHNKNIDAKYGHPTRFGLPAMIVLDPEGKELTTENTGELEQERRYSPEKVMVFLKKWSPKQ